MRRVVILMAAIRSMLAGGLAVAALPVQAAEPVRLYLHSVVTQKDTGGCLDIREEVRSVYESRRKVHPAALRPGERLTFVLVDAKGAGENPPWERCSGSGPTSFTLDGVRPGDRNHPFGRLERREEGAFVFLSIPMVPDAGGGELGGCVQVHHATFDLTEDELGRWETLVATSHVAEVFEDAPTCSGESRATLTTRPVEEDKVTVEGPGCLCAEGPEATFTAAGPEGARFEPFEVRTVSAGSAPVVVRNQGGATPSLTLKAAAGADTGRTEVVAVFKRGSRTLRSEPHVVHFCEIEKPRPRVNRWHVVESDWRFDESDPARLEIELESGAKLDGEDASDRLRWEISRNGDGLLRKDAEPTARLKLIADRMPRQNAGFGEREVTAVFRDEGCSCKSEPRQVRLFFPRDATNNPGGEEPNWIYYWRQTRAGRSAQGKGMPFEYRKTMPPVVNCVGMDPRVISPADPRAVARYDMCTETIYLTASLVKPGGCAPRWPNAPSDEGIDCFAATLRHENHHRTQLRSWWGQAMSSYTVFEDGDFDLVPTQVEDKVLGCDSGNAWSCPGRPAWVASDLTDIEYESYQVGWSWKPGTADSEDWACPGKQCKAP